MILKVWVCLLSMPLLVVNAERSQDMHAFERRRRRAKLAKQAVAKPNQVLAVTDIGGAPVRRRRKAKHAKQARAKTDQVLAETDVGDAPIRRRRKAKHAKQARAKTDQVLAETDIGDVAVRRRRKAKHAKQDQVLATSARGSVVSAHSMKVKIGSELGENHVDTHHLSLEEPTIDGYTFRGMGCCENSKGYMYSYEKASGETVETVEQCAAACAPTPLETDVYFVGINFHPDWFGESNCNCMRDTTGNGRITSAGGWCTEELCYSYNEADPPETDWFDGKTEDTGFSYDYYYDYYDDDYHDYYYEYPTYDYDYDADWWKNHDYYYESPTYDWDDDWWKGHDYNYDSPALKPRGLSKTGKTLAGGANVAEE